jgi:cytidylate kinase
MRILITGTSSSGKTSITNTFPRKYKKIHVDDYWDKAYTKTYSKLKNDYYDQEELDKDHYKEVRKMMKKDGKGYDNVIFDDVDITILNYLPKDTKKVLIYAGFKDLTRNLIRRRKKEPRKSFIYEQFAEWFEVTDDVDQAIDIINIRDFIKQLKKVKWNFGSERELRDFAKMIFLMMGIDDRKNHYIKLRNDIYDVIINTEDKKPKEIYYDIKETFDL